MIDIDSYVYHKLTNEFGKVLGYGYKIVDGDYLTTLKVELLEEGKIQGFTEDVYTEWIPEKPNLVQYFSFSGDREDRRDKGGMLSSPTSPPSLSSSS